MKRIGIILFICLILLTGYVRLISLMGPVDVYDTEPRIVIIKSGTLTKEISDLLRDRNLIKSEKVFNLMLSVSGLDDNLQAGYYELKPSDNMWKIIYKLTTGKVATFKVTIPEGYTVEQIAARLGKVSFFKAEDFIRLIKKERFNRPYLPDSDYRYKYCLEGFLYPDTYIIPREYNPEQILNVMLDSFEERRFNRL